MTESMQSPKSDAILNARFDRILSMISQLREFSNDETITDDEYIPANERLTYAIDQLADDIHDCDHDSHDSADNPYPMNESDFDAFLTFIHSMHD